MTLHRNDTSFSQAFAANEDVFIKVTNTNKNNEQKIFKMNTMQKNLDDNFILARNQGLLWSHTNVDKNGKAAFSDKVSGNPIYVGNGIVPQIERFAHIVAFDTLLTDHFVEAMDYMSAKSDNIVGNDYVVICNSKLYSMVNKNLREYIRDWKTCGSFLWSKATGSKVPALKVGATYVAYEANGNTITFMPDRALDLEYPYDAYGFMMDLTPDLAKGRPAIETFTFKGLDFVHSSVKGVKNNSCATI